MAALSWLSQSEPADSVFHLRAVETASAPTIDGMVDADEWRGAAVAGDFIQYEPRHGRPSETRTDVLVLYDSAFFYVALLESHRRLLTPSPSPLSPLPSPRI